MDISKIKLIIWDLDETFWKGTISEQKVAPQKQVCDLILMSSEKGIVNSICSKNDEKPCREKLEEWGVWDYFVFASINWQPKGQRIKNIISDMNLRAANVLFIDDNRLNLEEARYYCPEIMTASPDITDELFKSVAAMKGGDGNSERLNRYKVLEKKHRERNSMSSNEEFLRKSNIKLQINNDFIN